MLTFHRVRTIRLAWLVVVLCLTPRVHGQTAFDSIDRAGARTRVEHLTFVVDQSLMDEVASQFVEPQHHGAAGKLFARYQSDIEELNRDAAREADRAGLGQLLSLIAELAPARDPERMRSASPEDQRQLVAQTIESLDDPRWEDARELAQDVESALDRANTRADARLRHLVQELCALSEPPIAAPSSISRFIRRRLMDIGWHNESDVFAATVDILELARAASRPGSELGPTLTVATDGSPPGVHPSTMLKEILESYSAELDQYLVARLSERRRRNTTRATPLMAASNDRAFERVEKRQGRYWYRRFLISKRASDSIEALLLEHADEAAARAWRGRFLAALCPEIVEPCWFHGMTDWLVSRSDATPEQLEACQELQASFSARWSDLATQAVASGIVAMERHGSTQRHSGSGQLDKYVERLGNMHEFSRHTLSHFMGFLDETQQQDLVRELRATERSAALLDRFGPRLHHVLQREHRRELAELLAD